MMTSRCLGRKNLRDGCGVALALSVGPLWHRGQACSHVQPCECAQVPFEWLLPQCGLFVHHGGSGSFSAAVHAAVPQVRCHWPRTAGLALIITGV